MSKIGPDLDPCTGDYLAIYDGTNSSAPLIKKTCGTSVPTDIKSTQKHMYIVFFSDWDSIDNGVGFAASYYSGSIV